MTDAELAAIERAAERGQQAASDVFRLLATLREMRAAARELASEAGVLTTYDPVSPGCASAQRVVEECIERLAALLDGGEG